MTQNIMLCTAYAGIKYLAVLIPTDRIPSNHLDDRTPLVTDIDQFENKEYLLSKHELGKLKSDFTTLVSRVLVEFFPCLKFLNDDICKHIPHRYIYCHWCIVTGFPDKAQSILVFKIYLYNLQFLLFIIITIYYFNLLLLNCKPSTPHPPFQPLQIQALLNYALM